MQTKPPKEMVRLSIQVPPPPLSNHYQLTQLDNRVSGRKFVLPVDANATLLEVCDDIERHYRANYLRDVQFFKIAKLQDGYDADISLDMIVRDVFQREPGIENIIKVHLWDNEREMSILPTSMLIPEQARLGLKRSLNTIRTSQGKRRRIEQEVQEPEPEPEHMEFGTIIQSREFDSGSSGPEDEGLIPYTAQETGRLLGAANSQQVPSNAAPLGHTGESSLTGFLKPTLSASQLRRQSDVVEFAILKSPQGQTNGDIYDISDDNSEPNGALPQSSHGPASLATAKTPANRQHSGSGRGNRSTESGCSVPQSSQAANISRARLTVIQFLQDKMILLGLAVPSPPQESEDECDTQNERTRQSWRKSKRRARYVRLLEKAIREEELRRSQAGNAKDKGKRKRGQTSPEVVIVSPSKSSRTKPKAHIISNKAFRNETLPLSQRESRPVPERSKEKRQVSDEGCSRDFDDIPSAQPVKTTPPARKGLKESTTDEHPLEELSSTIKKRRVLEKHPVSEVDSDEVESDHEFDANPDPASPTAQKLRRKNETTPNPANPIPRKLQQHSAKTTSENSPISDTQPTEQLLYEEEAAERKQVSSAETASQHDRSIGPLSEHAGDEQGANDMDGGDSSDDQHSIVVGRNLSPELGDPNLEEMKPSTEAPSVSSNREDDDVEMEDATDSSSEPDSDTSSESDSDSGPDLIPARSKNLRNTISASQPVERLDIASPGVPRAASQAVNGDGWDSWGGRSGFPKSQFQGGANTIAELMERTWSPPK